MNYPFKTSPYLHQLAALERCWKEEDFALFMEMGTGKTKVALDNLAMLYDAGKINGALILAPKGVCPVWTENEIPTHFPDHISLRLGLWRSSLRKQQQLDLDALFEVNDDFCILVMNVEALATKRGTHCALTFLITRKAAMVVDESTTIKSPKAKRTKAIIKLGTEAVYRRILTGSPVTKSPLDLYTQCEFLDPHLLGFSSYYSFRNRFAVIQPKNFGGKTFQQVVGYQHVEELAEMIKPFSYRVTKDECLDLPPKIYTKREITMSKEQARIYEQMKEEAIAFLDEGEATVTHVITQILRLHQISCGHLPNDDGVVQEFENTRLTELQAILEETDGKVIIWANYRYDIKRIAELLGKVYGPDSYVTYFGDTNSDDRARALTSFQDQQSPVRYFLGNSQTGGYGITLTAASTVVYFSNNYDLEKRLQSEDRAHRIGQHNPVVYVDIVTKGTIDEKILTALRNKDNIARKITGDNWREWI